MARPLVVEAGRRFEERPEQPPTKLESQRVGGGDACCVLVRTLVPSSSDQLLDVRKPVLKPPDVVSVQKRAGDDLPTALGPRLDDIARHAGMPCGHQIFGEIVQDGRHDGFFVAEVAEDQPGIHP